MKGKTLNTRKANIYSNYFEHVYCEGFINGSYGLDTLIVPSAKRCAIEVIAMDGAVKKVDVYWMPLGKRSKNVLAPAPGVPAMYDADRFYAVMNDYKDTAIIQRFTFEKIFRMGYEFYTPDDLQGVNRIEVPKGAGDVIRMPSKK